MNSTEKIIAIAGVGGLLWWYITYTQGQSHIAAVVGGSVPPANTALPSMAADPSINIPPTVQVLPAPAVVSAAAANNLPVQNNSAVYSAMLQWANSSQNPPLMISFINTIDAADTAGLYDLIVNDWESTGKPTVAQVNFWNDLRSRYPFLNTGGVGCLNFQCN
jgi:hypothetical protein